MIDGIPLTDIDVDEVTVRLKLFPEPFAVFEPVNTLPLARPKGTVFVKVWLPLDRSTLVVVGQVLFYGRVSSGTAVIEYYLWRCAAPLRQPHHLCG